MLRGPALATGLRTFGLLRCWGRGVRDQRPRAGTGATRMKVEVIGFGLLVPIFFVTAGVQFDLAALASSTADLVLVPPKWCPASLDVFTRRDA